MATIITVANRKGGVGKTTLATNLAVTLSKRGKVLLVDGDEQKSAWNWNEYRTNKLESLFVMDNLLDTLEPLNDKYDYILIDVAGRDSQIFRESLLVSSKLIVPTQPSLLDLEVIPYISEKVSQAHDINPDLRAYVVINKASANYRNNEVSEAQKYIADFGNLTLCDTVIYDRKLFRNAIIESLSVSEMGDSKANDELTQFIKEVL